MEIKNLMQMWEMHAILGRECFEFEECKRSAVEPGDLLILCAIDMIRHYFKFKTIIPTTNLT
jgi:hypothetical protein